MLEYFERDYPTAHMNQLENDEYTLEEMFQRLEHIKNAGEGPFSFSKGLYCLVKEIKEIKTKVDRIYVASKYLSKDMK